MNILIGTPSTGDVKNAYCQSVSDLQRDLMIAGHSVQLHLTRGTDIVHQRNLIASRFVEARQFSHLLFIDSDIQFPAAVVLKMLGMAKPMVGAVYPNRYYRLDKMIALARAKPDAPASEIIARSNDYTLRISQKSEAVNGACLVDGLGMGLILIERSVFEVMTSRGVAKIKRNDKFTLADLVKNGIFNFFDVIYEGDDYLGEDFSFCRRWKQCDGEIWAIIDADIGHIGDVRVGGAFQDSQ